MRKYLDWIDDFEPEIPHSVRNRMEELLLKLVETEKERSGIRAKESVIRSAFTISRFNHRNLRTEDVVRAIKLLYPDSLENLEEISP